MSPGQNNSIIISTVVAFVVITLLVEMDGRNAPRERLTRYSIRNSTWKKVVSNELYSGWFRRNLRLSKESFFIIAGAIEDYWHLEYHDPHHNTIFSIQERVALTIHFLCTESGYATAGNLFGLSRTSAHRYVEQVMNILLKYFIKIVSFPSTNEHWENVAVGFEKICGVPNVVGAIDGTLIQIHRFEEFEGWYCRKGFPAFNVQVLLL